MATMEDRVMALETRVSAIEAVLTQMHERLNAMRAWLMALTGLGGGAMDGHGRDGDHAAAAVERRCP